VEDRFDFQRDAREDLILLKQRLEQLDLGARSQRDSDDESFRRASSRGFLKRKVKPFLKRLSQLWPNRRRIGRLKERIKVLEDEIANLRKLVISVIDSELATSQRRDLEHVALHGQMESLTRALDGDRAIARDQIAALSHAWSEERLALRDQIAALSRAWSEGRLALRDQIEEIERLLRMERLTRQKAFTNFDRRLTLAAVRNPQETSTDLLEWNAASPSTSVQSLLESFYFLLEERYRGTREEIKQRLLIYRNDFRAARDRAGVAGPIIDIGCGRGELLEVLQEDGFQAIGVDTNDTQLEAARRRGMAVMHVDALAHLRTLGDDSVLAIAGIHVVEHIPFPELTALMQEVARVLKKGGVAVFETPNPRNLIVGATTFHLDPTHVRPLPPEVLQILLETVGFGEVEQRPLHPSETLDYMVKHHNLDLHIATLLFGPQDYAAIGVMR